MFERLLEVITTDKYKNDKFCIHFGWPCWDELTNVLYFTLFENKRFQEGAYMSNHYYNLRNINDGDYHNSAFYDSYYRDVLSNLLEPDIFQFKRYCANHSNIDYVNWDNNALQIVERFPKICEKKEYPILLNISNNKICSKNYNIHDLYHHVFLTFVNKKDTTIYLQCIDELKKKQNIEKMCHEQIISCIKAPVNKTVTPYK